VFGNVRAVFMDDFRDAEEEKYTSVMAMIPLAEGKPVVLVDETDQSVFVCRRVSGLHLVRDECVFYGECDWVDPPEERPDELTDGMAISYPDCLDLGPGWWYDSYFHWYFVYEPTLVAQSLAGDHSWVAGVLASDSPPTARPSTA
jgi:hypothetical protein